MAKSYGFQIIEAAQKRCTNDKITRHAEISFPTRHQHHRREMAASRTATDMDTCGIAAKFARVSVHPSDGCAALARDFGERDGWGKRVIYRHYAGAGLGKVLRHEAGISTVEQTPVAAVYENKDRRWLTSCCRKNVKPFGLACAIGNSEPARQARTHTLTLGSILSQDRRDVRHGCACV